MPEVIQHNTDASPTVAELRDGTVHVYGAVNYLTGVSSGADVVLGLEADRWFIVVGVSDNGPSYHAYSRRLPGPRGAFSGEWGLLDEDEAQELAAAVNAAPDPEGEHINAVVAEVYRFAGDPTWTEG